MWVLVDVGGCLLLSQAVCTMLAAVNKARYTWEGWAGLAEAGELYLQKEEMFGLEGRVWEERNRKRGGRER